MHISILFSGKFKDALKSSQKVESGDSHEWNFVLEIKDSSWNICDLYQSAWVQDPALALNPSFLLMCTSGGSK